MFVEVCMFCIIGGDVVGMFIVSEVIVVCYVGMKVLGIFCIFNMVVGILDQLLNYEEVIEMIEKVKQQFLLFVKEVVKQFLVY